MVNYQLPADVMAQNQGLMGSFVYLSEQVPILFPAVLAFFWFLIMFGGYIMEDKTKGSSSIWLWAALAGVIVTVVSFILYLYPGIISLWTVITYLVITLGAGLAYFLTDY